MYVCTYICIYVRICIYVYVYVCVYVCMHRRIQDFVRGGGQGPLGPRGGGGPRPSWPPGGGGPRPSWPAPHYLGEQYFVGRGGQGPLGPPLDPRMVCIYGPVHVGGSSRLPAPLPPGCSHSHPTNSCSCLLYPVYEHPKTRHNTNP